MNLWIGLTLVATLVPAWTHDEKDEKAQKAFEALQETWNKKAGEYGLTEEPTPEKITAFYQEVLIKDLESFIKEWKGTHAAIEAKMGLANILSNEQFGGSFEKGYEVATELVQELAKSEDHLDEWGQANMLIVEMCMNADQFDKAEKHVDSFLAAVEERKKALAEGESLPGMFEELSQHFQQLKETLPIRKQLMVGKTFPDFRAETLKGGETGPADYRGKVLLIDFWATWCGPCIGELPNVLDAYGKYKDQGFEILAVSLDNSKEKLEQFIENRKMPWKQVFDGQGWQNAVAVKFGVNSIPATFLLDRKGVLRYKDLRGEELGERVRELLEEGEEKEDKKDG